MRCFFLVLFLVLQGKFRHVLPVSSRCNCLELLLKRRLTLRKTGLKICLIYLIWVDFWSAYGMDSVFIYSIIVYMYIIIVVLHNVCRFLAEQERSSPQHEEVTYWVTHIIIWFISNSIYYFFHFAPHVYGILSNFIILFNF